MCTIAIKGMLYSVTGIKFHETGEALLLAPVQYDVSKFIGNYYWQNAKIVPLEELDFDEYSVGGLVEDIHKSSDEFRAGRGYLCEMENKDAWIDSRQPYMPHWCSK
jgi:hypothetical protein